MFNVGDTIDERYDIIGILGYGGMAQVFKAHDKHLDRDVALKVLRPHLTDNDQARFRREIQALAKLSHPGIVSIYDLGLKDYVYFAMELVDGGMFTDLGPLDLDLEPLLTFLDAAITVSETLAYIHEHRMVHRDVTQRNILLAAGNKPKVMDFGLVQLAEATRDITRTGLALGTPQYMAPEQAKGGETTAQTDLYALGVVFYRTATGKLPFDAENDQAILYQHVYAEVKLPHKINPHVPLSLSKLILSLLAKNPKARPNSGYRVVEILKNIRSEAEQESSSQRLGGPSQNGFIASGIVYLPSLQPLWQIKLPQGPQWPSAITSAEGFILLGLRSEEVYVVNPTDGSTYKSFQANDEINSPIVYQPNRFNFICDNENENNPIKATDYQKGQLYYTSRSGALSALKWPSGKAIWQKESDDIVGILTYAENIFVSSRQSWLELRTASNNTVWRYELDSSAATTPTVHRKQVYVISRSGWLHAISTSTGKGLYKLQLDSVAAQPSALKGILLLPERSGDLHAFNTDSHEVLWSYDTEGEIWATPLAWQEYVYVVSWSGILYCLALYTGDDVWTFDLQSKVTASPILAGGVLYLGTEEGEVMAFDARAGRMLFRDKVSLSPIQATPLVLGQKLIVAALDGTVKAYG